MIPGEHGEECRLINRINLNDSCPGVTNIRTYDNVFVEQYKDSSTSTKETIDPLVRYQLVVDINANSLQNSGVLI